jgi:hypothetical protein
MPALTLRRLLPTALAAALLAVPAAASADVSGAQIVSFINAQRAAHGFPADIVEDATLSADCALHNQYGALNDVLAHSEDPTRPGYTAGGSMAAGSAVLYKGTTWTSAANPFDMAPIHLNQLLSPLIDRIGASENGGYGCATTLASTKRPPAAVDTLLPFPADGTRGWRASEIDREGPMTPGETVGIPQGTTTGPTLYALASGPGVTWTSATKVESASLTGPGGPVDIVTFDRSSPQIGNYLPAGAQLLPRAPLAPGTTYTAALRLRVTTATGTRVFSRTWSLTTAGTPPAGQPATASPAAATPAAAKPCTTKLRYGGLSRSAGLRRLAIRATACAATNLRVTVKRGPRAVLTYTKRLTAGVRTAHVVLPRSVTAGRYTVRVTIAGATLTVTRLLPGR